MFFFFFRKTFYVTQLDNNYQTTQKLDTNHHVEAAIFSVRPSSSYFSNGIVRSEFQPTISSSNGINYAGKTITSQISPTDEIDVTQVQHRREPQEHTSVNENRPISVISLIQPDEVTHYSREIKSPVSETITEETLLDLSSNQESSNHSEVSETSSGTRTENGCRPESVISLIQPDEVTSYRTMVSTPIASKATTSDTIIEERETEQPQEKTSVMNNDASDLQDGNNVDKPKKTDLPEYTTIDKTMKKVNSKENISDIDTELPDVVRVLVNRDSTLSIDEKLKPAVPPKTPESMQFVDY